MKDNPNIDELLNGYIDGQLSTRNQTEVKRLIQHDPEVAKRLRQLQKCKMLVSSLPSEHAPEGLLEDVKADLERRTLLDQHGGMHKERQGARYLLARKVLTAAAMIALAAVLSTVVYLIIAPQAQTEKTMALKSWQEDAFESVEKPATKIPVATPFNGRLVLSTNNPNAANAVIRRAIDDNIPLAQAAPAALSNVAGPYVLSCSREDFASLLADLEKVWDKFDSATLFVENDQIAVNNIIAKQVIEITQQDILEDRTKLAKDFAALNNMSEQMPGKEVFATLENVKPELMIPPKPVLTSSARKTKKVVTHVPDEQKINITIVVTDN